METNQEKIQELQKKVNRFNNTYSVGCKVDVTLDSDIQESVTIAKQAYVFDGHSAVVEFEELPGIFSIERVNKYNHY